MEAKFWQDRWQENRIGFHESAANPALVNHIQALNLQQNARIFVPLCGKSLDLGWLLTQGYRVAGCELVALAVEQLFEELGETPVVDTVGSLQRFSIPALDVYVGDIFELDATELGAVDAVYDRAALVALPDQMRRRYASHLMSLTNRAQQLIVTFDYDQSKMDGPPFSVPDAMVAELYDSHYQLTLLQAENMAGGLKQKVTATERIWHLV